MKTEFKFALRRGHLATMFVIFVLLVITGATAVLTDVALFRLIGAMLTVGWVGLLWLGYRRTLSCRSIYLENSSLVVAYRSGEKVQFALPDAIKEVIVLSEPHVSSSENIQFKLIKGKTTYLLNTGMFENPRELVIALEKMVPVSRCYADGRIEVSRLCEIQRNTDFVNVVGNPKEAQIKVQRQQSTA